MRTPYAALLAGLCLTLTTSGCSGGDDSDPQTVDVVVGGGGEGDRIDGLVSDLSVSGDQMVLVGYSRQGDPVLWRSEKSGSVEEMPLTGLGSPSDVALADDGSAYVLDGSGVWKLGPDDADQPELVVGGPDAPSTPEVKEKGSVEAIALDPDGQLLWTATETDPKDPANPDLVVVRRWDGQQVEVVAGTTKSPAMDPQAVHQQMEDPGAGTPAVGFPMQVPGPTYGLAADDTGVYLLGAGYVLKVDPDGTLSKVLGGQGRDVPTAPFESEASALDHGFTVGDGGLAADGGVFAVRDTSLEGEQDADDAFAWSGDFDDEQQKLVDNVTDASSDAPDFGDVALVVEGTEASTGLAHISALAPDDGKLYAVGQAGDTDDPAGLEAIVVSTQLPD